MNPHSASQFVFCGSERSLIRQRSACLKESLWEGSSGRPGYMLGGATRHLLRGDIAKNCVEKRAAWFFYIHRVQAADRRQCGNRK